VKRMVAFDLDGTLALSKQAIDREMALLLARLTGVMEVAVISGGDWPQFEAQLVGQLPAETRLERLFLLPTSGTKLYRYTGSWRQVYAENLGAGERASITQALKEMTRALGLECEPNWGAQIEDRATQMTFSALGQQAPPEAKLTWDPALVKRRKIQAWLSPRLPGFAVRIGGSTSIDITRQGVDKGYGIVKLSQNAGIALGDILFVGDALFPGGNDHAVIGAGVDTISVRDVEETKRIIETMIRCRQ
jgi:phosphomannomutase